MAEKAHGPPYGKRRAGPRRHFSSGGIVEAKRYTPQQAAQADLRFRRDVERLYRLGPRVLLEFLAELGARRLIRSEIEQLAGQFASLDPETVRTIGADKLPPLPPLRLVVDGDSR